MKRFLAFDITTKCQVLVEGARLLGLFSVLQAVCGVVVVLGAGGGVCLCAYVCMHASVHVCVVT